MTGQSYDWGWIFNEFSMKMNDNFHQTPIYMYVYIYMCVCSTAMFDYQRVMMNIDPN
jgi:hypothetical protein